MNNKRNISQSRPIISQTKNNTTLWIGHLSTDTSDHLGGQTFTCPAEGLINNIQVYSASVQHPGQLRLSLHEFDCQLRNWGKPIAESGVLLEKSDESSWVRFELDPVLLKKDGCYAFRLQTDDAMIGLGEAASPSRSPFEFGLSWNADTYNTKGRYFKYFSLAFKVEICA